MPAEILTETDQRAMLAEVSSPTSYLDLYKRIHSEIDSMEWMHIFRNRKSIVEAGGYNHPEYYRLHGFMALLFAQYGFSTMEGLIGRHSLKGFKGKPLSMLTALNTVCYGGTINHKAHELKQADEQRIIHHNPELTGNVSMAIYGVPRTVENATVSDKREFIEYLLILAKERLQSSQPILLSMPSVYTALNNVNLDVAVMRSIGSRLPFDNFMSTYFKGVSEALNGFVDLEALRSRTENESRALGLVK